MKKGINPITVRGKDGNPNVSIGRLWVQDGSGQLSKKLTLLLWTGEDEEPKIAGQCVMDENKFVEALGHLFPNGELGDTPPADEDVLKKMGGMRFFTRGGDATEMGGLK